MKISKISIILITFMLLFCITASAAPEVIWKGEVGNVSDLIVITNPPKDKSATFDKSYIISGYGKEGTTVTIYKDDGSSYKKTSYSWQIGASGLFFKRIELSKGKNAIICFAESGSGSTQYVPLEITYLGTGFSDMLSGIKVDINNIWAK